MDKRSREKIALVFFVVLIFAALGLLLLYFTTGRSWNVAASYVDDQVGEMEDYTVIVYGGTVEPTEAEVSEAEGATWIKDDSSAAGAQNDSDDDSRLMDPSQSDEILDLGGLEEELPHKERVYVSDVRKAYQEKGASVLTLDADDLDYYAEPTILYADDRVFGIFSVDYYATEALLKQIRKELVEQGAQTIICITKRTSLLATPEYADVVIVSSQEEGLSTGGHFVDDAFVVQSPDKGSVGAVVITTTNISSARVIEAS